VEEQPDSPFAETFKFTRVNLQYYYKKEEKVIGITSSVEGEGKTFCSSNLAATFAQAKKRTLLIYGDLRRPKVGSYFKIHGPGLTDYILNKASLEEIIQPTHVNNLQVILPGRPTFDPLHILEDSRMESLIGELRGVYDTIIIDTPPIGYVTDYFAFSRYLDISILIVRYNYTNKHFLRGTEEKLKKHKINNLNLLFNDVEHQSSFKYGYYTSSNGYYTSSKKGKGSAKKRIEKLNI
jgi:capsular exopolysaccharide synthesis family protein